MFEHYKGNDILIGESEKYFSRVLFASILFFSALQIFNAIIHMFSYVEGGSCIVEAIRLKKDKEDLSALGEIEFYNSFHSYICISHNIFLLTFVSCLVLYLIMSLISNYTPTIRVKPIFVTAVIIAIYYHGVFYGGFRFATSHGGDLSLHPATESVYVVYMLVAPMGCFAMSMFCLIVARMVQVACQNLKIKV